MKRKTLMLIALLCSFHLVFAQDTIYIKKLNATFPISLRMPILMDSTNVKGESYASKNFLESYVQLPASKDYKEMYDTFGDEIELPKAQSDYQIQFLGFQLAADRHSKNTIKITIPCMAELYVDGKKEGTKTTTEKEVKKAKSLVKEITLLPNQARNIIVKYLTTSKDEEGATIKIAVYSGKKDAGVNYVVSHDSKRFTKVQDGMEGTRVTSTRISPNGQFVLVSYRSVDKAGKAAYFTELRNLKSGSVLNLGASSATWMPESNKYYYTKQYLDNLQLITVNPEDLSETIIADNIPKGSFRFSPDETFLLYSDKEENDDRKGDFKLLKAPDDRQEGFMNRYYIHKYDLATGVKQRLTFGKNSTSLNDISPDSRYVIYSYSEPNITERPFRKTSMYMLDLETMKVDTLWKDEKFAYGGSFSPDMKNLIVTGAPEAFDAIGENVKEGQIANSYDVQAYIFNLESKKVTPITKEFNPSVKSAFWSKYDNLIYLSVADKDCENIYTYNPKNEKFTKLNLPESVISSFTVAKSANAASFIGRSISNPARAYSYDLKSGKTTLLNDPMKDIMSDVQLGEVHDWNFTSSDGTVIEGFYHLPPNFDSSKKYPMIVYYYGGTTPSTRTFEHPYSMHNFAALGYVVYTINPSGAIGYGQEFSARHVNAWGKRTAEDIIEGTKEFVKQHTFVDDKKLGCVGASYGGFMTMYLQTQTDMFAAAISHAGISALSSYWGEGYWGYSYSSGASAHSYPWNNPDLYVKQSPLFNADKVKTPILFTHGTVDTNVPIGESIQMYTALKILGVPVEFLQVKDENHGIMKHDRRIHWSYSMYAWFDKWLKDQPEWWDALYPDKNK